MSESFLSQLEQRTQQVKITLANLEAEKTRIENQIAALEPLVPQYDALLGAERALADANIALAEASPTGHSEPASNWNAGGEHSSGWNS